MRTPNHVAIARVKSFFDGSLVVSGTPTPTSAKAIGLLLGLPERSVRRAIRSLNAQGYTLVADPRNGIRTARSYQEMQAYADSLLHQASVLQERAGRVQAVADMWRAKSLFEQRAALPTSPSALSA